MNLKLGKHQKAVIVALVEEGPYYHASGCRWVYGTHQRTVQILETLVKRGLVTKREQKLKTAPGVAMATTVYRVNPRGIRP